MQEPGVGEGTPKNPIIDKIQTAKKSLQENNDAPAREIVNSIAGELSHQIEYGKSSDDPLAYTLKRVATEGLLNYLTYLLEPPVAIRDDRKVRMIYVEQIARGASASNQIRLLDNSTKTDPYDKFAVNRALGINTSIRKEQQIAFLDSVALVNSDIAAHGIRKNPADFTAVHRGSPLSAKFDEYVKSLPFSGKLKFSPESQEPQKSSSEMQKPTASLVQEAKKAERIDEERKVIDEEQGDKEKIKEYLSKPGVRDVLKKFSDKFNQETGKQFVYGISADGLIVAVRSECSENESGDDYYKAWVLDAKLPSDEIESKMIATSINANNVGSMNDNLYFPQFGRSLRLTVLSPDADIRQSIFHASDTQVEFYKKTGGFQATYYSFENGQKLDKPIFSIGEGRKLYPLDLG